MSTRRLQKIASGDIACVPNRGRGVRGKGWPPGHGRAGIDEVLPIRMWGTAPRAARVPTPTATRNQGVYTV